jgi:hypothetical protein
VPASAATVVMELDPQIQSLGTAAEVLNRHPDGVAATAFGDQLKVALVRPVRLGGVAAHYGARPYMRATVTRDGAGLRLTAAVVTSPWPRMLNGAAGLAALLVVAAGSLIVLEGDPSGVIAIVFGALAGIAIIAGSAVMSRLVREDEKVLRQAIGRLGRRADVTPPRT